MSTKYCKLIMVAVNDGSKAGAAQSNKYYEMKWDGKSSNFNVEFGRVESSKQTTSYPIGQWEKKYREKVAKGYKDVTDMIATVVVEAKKADDKLAKIEEAKVERFMQLMQQYTNGLVAKTYSVKSDNVTQKQIDEAQSIIDKLTKADQKDVTSFNSLLLQLYITIPRAMGNVKNHLLPNISDISRTLQQEQDNLDAMASQVALQAPKKKVSAKEKKENQTLLDKLGLTMTEIKAPKELDYLIKQLTSNKIDGVFEVKKKVEDDIFIGWLTKQKNKDIRILIHGTRCTSVIPILETGLKIRPAGNFQFSGKVYGDGNYFSETCQKSLGYTGYDNDQILLVYEVHTGKPFTYDGWYKGNSFTLCYKELEKRGFDSTFVKAGGGLLNTEIIAYKEEQSRIRYIIHLKR